LFIDGLAESSNAESLRAVLAEAGAALVVETDSPVTRGKLRMASIASYLDLELVSTHKIL
jgi:hypothetical protein